MGEDVDVKCGVHEDVEDGFMDEWEKVNDYYEEYYA